MDRGPERITWKTIIGWFVLAILIALVAAPVSIWVGPAGQPIVVRFAVAVFCAVIVYRLAVVIREAALVGQMTPAEIAMQPRKVEVQTDPLLTGLASELRGRIWWHVAAPALWAHLLQLCQRRGAVPPAELLPEPGHHPTWQDAERMIHFLEDAT